MPDTSDLAIATAAAEAVIIDDENRYAGAWRRLIPDDAAHKLAVEVATAILAAQAKARAAKPA